MELTLSEPEEIVELKNQGPIGVNAEGAKRKPEIKFFHPYNFILFFISMFVFVPVVFHRMVPGPDLPGFLTVFPVIIAVTLVFSGYLIISGIVIALLKFYVSHTK